MAQPPVVYFEIHVAGQPVRMEQSTLSAIKIGSHAKSHVHIEDPEVGRVHAVVEKSDLGVFVIDLGSGRATFVNGERVNKKQLQHRDRIRMGSTELVYMTHDEAALAAAAQRQKRAIDPRTNRPRDEVLYARRFLARPAATDGSVEIAMLWRDYVMAEELYQPPDDVVVGPSDSATFPVEHASLSSDLTLVSANGGSPTLNFPVGAAGEVYVGSERLTLEEAVASGRARASGGVASMPLSDETRAKIMFGDVSFYVHRTTKPKVLLPFERRTATPLLFLLFSAGLHGLLWLLIMFLPPGIGSLAMDSFGGNDRFVQILIQDPEPEVEETPPADDGEEDDGQGQDQDEGEIAEGDEGRAGDETAEDTPAQMAIEGDLPEGEMELARQDALNAVQDRGALAVLNSQPNIGPSALFGAGPSGSDAVMAIGAVQGDGVGASYGNRGLGSYGGGLSGGGRHAGSVRSAGRLAIGGRSTGSDSNTGRRLAQIDQGREARTPTVRMESPQVNGQLDRDIIARVIREHRREIRACYEQELQSNPNLEGRLLVAFVIAPDGQVAGTSIRESSLNNSVVERCVERRMRQWRFPEPRGGGTVQVNYPFVFSPG